MSYSSPDCAEVYCMGVKQAYHGRGIGRELLSALETEAIKKVDYLQVKTIAPSYYAAYDQTNRFYQAMGFKQLEIFPQLWEEHIPCLILIKSIKN
ncbi:GNAT family acetyltransferase [Streptococcus massiliensis]|uniref:GNAT family acetyltransferase n=1 Tax=Streptococcus massiliensis TaxID=313439 RepID=A0A380KZ11_9STRE|nr:GNAT family acetyltransferase [Streptococcus massiliensis]